MLTMIQNKTFKEANQTYGLVFIADTDITSGTIYERPPFIAIGSSSTVNKMSEYMLP